MSSSLDRWFRPVLGRPCWGVRRGWGSFLTLEFGRPRLLVREPVSDLEKFSTKEARELFQLRQVTVRGQWHLWIYCCDWTVHHRGRLVGDSSSPRRIDRAAWYLDGQKLVDVSLAPRGARVHLTFDLGAVLTTVPYSRREEQWMLYEPGGNVLTFRADRHYCYAIAAGGIQRWRRAA